ncbi:MAG: peptide deformylase [Clostridia bacterium]|nr:peptide deformylase [Clostridia bacterium]
MAVLKIIKDGDETLRRKCRPVVNITPHIIKLLDDMKDTLHKANGVGLAAPQVGVLRRIAIVECEEGELIELINPEIIEQSGEQEEVEGCLSVPGRWGITRRPEKVKVRATDRNGDTFEVEGEGLLARALCHETDHLDGIIFYDKAVRMLSKDEIEND